MKMNKSGRHEKAAWRGAHRRNGGISNGVAKMAKKWRNGAAHYNKRREIEMAK
jgi:hypothetical protein